MSGDSTWDAHDIDKAKRSIRRHNKTCLIIDRRDQILIDSGRQTYKSANKADLSISYWERP